MISADGKWIAITSTAGPDKKPHLAMVPIAGGTPRKIFAAPGRAHRWTADGKFITYAETKGAVSELWNRPLGGGAPVVLLSDFE